MRICIIIPMYNEEEIAQKSLDCILEYAEKLPHDTTVLVVNDGSKDCTRSIVESIINSRNDSLLILINHETNKGYGGALRTGIKYSVENNYDYTLFMDSDLTNHPKYLIDFYKKIDEGFDYIKATRYSSGGGMEGVPLLHRIISIVGNSMAKILFRLPLNDYTNGFRAVRTELFKKIILKENSFVIIMEELFQVKHLTKSFAQVPYLLTSRKAGEGKSNFLYTPKTMWNYLKYAIK